MFQKLGALLALLCSTGAALAASSITVEKLRCEYLDTPLGVDVPAPRLSWILTSPDNGKKQTAYQLKVWEGTKEIWDSGKVASDATNQIAYAGPALKAHSTYFWRVISWDESSQPSAWSPAAKFVTGPLADGDWQAAWIGEPEVRKWGRLSGYFGAIPPSPLLRKEIALPAGKKIASAYLNATALGIYEIYINGKKVGKNVFAPEYTRYDKHLQFQTYDVTALLATGTNALGAMLGDGWFSGGRWQNGRRGGYGPKSEHRKLLAQLRVNYTDGTADTFGTDGSWKFIQDGPVTSAAFFSGEVFDANKDPKGWDKPGFDDSKWEPAPVFKKLQTDMADFKLAAQLNEPIAVIQELAPASFRRTGPNKYIFDMGQNIAGRCLLRLPYNPGKGKKIVLRHAEWVDGNKLYEDNLRGARGVDEYIAGDETEISYEPRFTYHGFRYVEVSGLTQPPDKKTLAARVVASSSPETGTFATSHKDVNQLWKNILWTQWGNLISIPTDCPQRDEREGYLADAQIFAQTASYNLDMAAFYTKWTRDIRDSQKENGPFPDFAPHDGRSRLKFYGAPGWTDGGVIIPWRVYENYGDKRILAANYAAMKKYVDWVARGNQNFLWLKYRNNDFSDWLSFGRIAKEIFATGYFYYSANTLAKTAAVLGKTDDAAKYAKLAANIQDAYNKAWARPDGSISGDSQATYAQALWMGIAPEKTRPLVAAKLAAITRGRMGTGIHSTGWLMESLADIGKEKLAYDLLFARHLPSWFYSLDQGATTIWERWDGYVRGRGFQTPSMNSLNHVAFGVVGEWMYRHIAGIQLDPANPGFRHFFVKPLPDSRLSWAKATYDSINGKIEVSWKRDDTAKEFVLEVKVPVNTTATVTIPYENKTHTVGSGSHKWVAKF
jgi:alpha-L-rhamnosidase